MPEPVSATPTYRERLRTEGLALAACGLVGSVVLLVLADHATDGPASTVGQLVVVAALLALLGPRAVRRWASRAPRVGPGTVSGDPTPLWVLPLIVAGLALLVGLPTGAWDAALRVTAGSALVGLAQAFLLERVAAREEERVGGALVRLPGSRLLTGTRLGILER